MASEVAVSASSSDEGPVHVWDFQTGTVLASFKGNASDTNGLAVTRHMLVATQRNKNQVLIWRWGKDQPLLRFAAPERLAVVALSLDGMFCAGGGESGKIYLWLVSTGDLLKAWDAHYGRVSKIVFTDDNIFLISSGEDACVNVWLMQTLSQDAMNHGAVPPVLAWTEHSLPVTDIACGAGGAHGWVATCSVDQTCRLWSLGSGSSILVVNFPTPLRCVIFDTCDTRLLTGGNDGRVYGVDLYRKPSQVLVPGSNLLSNAAPVSASARLPRSSSSAIVSAADKDLADAGVFALTAHSGPITSLSITMDGNTLLSSSEDGVINVWDLTYHQLLRTFSNHQGPVSFVQVLLRPSFLYDEGPGKHQVAFNSQPITQFKRAVRTRTDERHVYALLHTFPSEYGGAVLSSLEHDIYQPKTKVVVDVKAPQEQTETMESVLQQVDRLRTINDQLYEFALSQLHRSSSTLPTQPTE